VTEESGPKISVTISKKIFEHENKPVYEFTIKLHSLPSEYKVIKSYNDFVEMEYYLKSEFTVAKYP
jgi:hypothetical protein